MEHESLNFLHTVKFDNDFNYEQLLNSKFNQKLDENPIEIFKKGNKIHIKKKNVGSFTKYCDGKVTEDCIKKGKNSKDPKIRKKAVFAQNARVWKHEDGGLFAYNEYPYENNLENNLELNSENDLENESGLYYDSPENTINNKDVNTINPNYVFKNNTRDFNKFVSVLYPIYKKAFDDNKFTNYDSIKYLILQDGLESQYGTKSHGNYNLGGIKWFKGPHSNYNKILGGDNNYYIDFNNLSDYVNYKVKLLNNEFGAINAKSINQFVDILGGNNKKKKFYFRTPKKDYLQRMLEMLSLRRAYDTYYKKIKE